MISIELAVHPGSPLDARGAARRLPSGRAVARPGGRGPFRRSARQLPATTSNGWSVIERPVGEEGVRSDDEQTAGGGRADLHPLAGDGGRERSPRAPRPRGRPAAPNPGSARRRAPNWIVTAASGSPGRPRSCLRSGRRATSATAGSISATHSQSPRRSGEPGAAMIVRRGVLRAGSSRSASGWRRSARGSARGRAGGRPSRRGSPGPRRPRSRGRPSRSRRGCRWARGSRGS